MANVASHSIQVNTDASTFEKDAEGIPTWLNETGPKADSVVRSKRTGLKSYRDQLEPSKAELRALALQAANTHPITRID